MNRALLIPLLLVFLARAAKADDDRQAQGLVQTRFVTAEHITAPTGISVSPQGVAFVSCDSNGVTNTKKNIGKVVRCEDTNGDGRADKFSNFVSGINSPRGSCYVDDTLYLMQPPLLVAYQDPDGDGVAEQKTTLVTNLGPGLQTRGVIHGANGIRMGIDGWLYLTIGDQGCFQATGSDDHQVTLYGGGLLRVRPDGSQLSVLLTGTRNIYDVAVDPYLDLFARDNSNDGGGWGTRLQHLIELADFGYPQKFKRFTHETMPCLMDYGAGSGTSMYYMHEPGFPEDFGDALYSGDFNTGLWIHRRKQHAASHQVQQSSFMDSPKNIGIDVDGYSRMYSVSRLGGGFGFANERFGHVDLIQPANRKNAAAYPNVNEANDTELLAILVSRSQVARINAMREIVSRGEKPAITKGLLTIAEDVAIPLYARVAAVMTLKQLDGVKAHKKLQALYQDPKLREFIVRALGDVSGEIDGASKALLLQALSDDNPRVQLRAIIGLARSRDINAASAILPLAKEQKLIPVATEQSTAADGWSPPHRVIDHVALKAIVKLNAVDLLLAKLADRELRETALRALQEIHSKKVVSGLTAKVRTSSDKDLVKLITLALFRLYHQEAPWDGHSWWKNRPNFHGPYFRATPWAHTADVREAIELSFKKVDTADYSDLFKYMRRNGVPENELQLDIKYDEALALLQKESLTQEEFNFVMDAAVDPQRPDQEQLQIYNHFKRGPLPDSYINRVHLLRKWGEGRAKGTLQRRAYAEFVSGKEFIGRVEELSPFFSNGDKDCYKYAHIQIINLINDTSAPQETRKACEAEMKKTWADAKNIYRPYRLRGLMLAFEEVDPTPYAEQLKPLVDHRDERTKQGAARYLAQILEQREK